MSLGEKQAKQIVDRVLARAAKLTGAQALVGFASSTSGNTRFAVNQITTSGDAERHTINVEIMFGQRVARASTNQLDDAAIADVVERAARLAKLAPENAEAMPVLGPQKYSRVVPDYDGATSHAGAAERLRAPQTAIAQAEAAKVVIAGFYEHSETSRAIATSAGLWGFTRLTNVSYTCTARTPDGTGSGWAGGAGKAIADLDVEAMAKTAIDVAVRSAKPAKLEPGKYTVVLAPQPVSSLMQFLVGSFGAREADEGRSFFAKKGGGTRVGEKLFPDSITLTTEPSDAAVDGSPWDSDGLARQGRSWIDKGVVPQLAYSRYWAKKQGKTATGNDGGWTLHGAGATVDELVKGIDRGVLVTRVFYLRMVDPQTVLVTGLTRDGTFLIDHGAIAGPVNNFRFNHSPVTMLANCDGLGAPTVAPDDDGQPIRVPMLRTHEFNLASVSDAV